MIPEIPAEQPMPPRAVTDLAAGREVLAVWRNHLGGTTFQIGSGIAREFVKWAPVGNPVDLSAEAARMRWAAAFTPVPRVLDLGADETGTWLLTAGLSGESAVSECWRGEPAVAVRAIGEGLRAFHEALPVDQCPFLRSTQSRVAAIREQAAVRELDPEDWHEEHQVHTPARVLELISEIPPIDKEVVGHGDTCAPNTLIGDDGKWLAHVDLGSMGVADRWSDLAIATWSLEWNYGPGWQDLMLDAYGIAADPERIAYYRLLGDLD